MTALDDIREIEREASAFDRKLVRALIEEHANRMEERIRGLRDTLLDAPGEIIAFYKITDLPIAANDHGKCRNGLEENSPDAVGEEKRMGERRKIRRS